MSRGREEIFFETVGFFAAAQAGRLLVEQPVLQNHSGLIGENLKEREIIIGEDRGPRGIRHQHAKTVGPGGDGRGQYRLDAMRVVDCRVLRVILCGIC